MLLPGKSHGWRSLVGCSPWGSEESDMTEQLHFHFSLLCIGEENGNPLQCSRLENPRDGVTQSRTRLKRLSSSTSSIDPYQDFIVLLLGFLSVSVLKSLPANAGDSGSIPGVGKIPWRRKWQPTSVSLPGKSHGQRSLAGCSPWGRK